MRVLPAIVASAILLVLPGCETDTSLKDSPSSAKWAVVDGEVLEFDAESPASSEKELRRLRVSKIDGESVPLTKNPFKTKVPPGERKVEIVFAHEAPVQATGQHLVFYATGELTGAFEESTRYVAKGTAKMLDEDALSYKLWIEDKASGEAITEKFSGEATGWTE